MAATGALRAIDALDFLGGFVAAEGSLTRVGRRFAFVVALGAQDRATCELFASLLGVGSVRWTPRRRAHHDDVATYRVQSLTDLVNVVVPFLDEHLPPSYKRQQYEAWRADLLAYWDERAKRRRPCSIDGCERLRRAKGLCRQHYFAVYGR